jgi:signal transduction histidine kinase
MRNRLTERDLSRIVKRVVNENKDERRQIGRIVDDIISSFEFSEKGNDELITLANYLLTPEGADNVANQILGKLKKGFGAHDDDEQGFGVYTSDRESLRSLEDRFKSRR